MFTVGTRNFNDQLDCFFHYTMLHQTRVPFGPLFIHLVGETMNWIAKTNGTHEKHGKSTITCMYYSTSTLYVWPYISSSTLVSNILQSMDDN
jgi:hypothetical protein